MGQSLVHSRTAAVEGLARQSPSWPSLDAVPVGDLRPIHVDQLAVVGAGLDHLVERANLVDGSVRLGGGEVAASRVGTAPFVPCALALRCPLLKLPVGC